MDTIRLFLRSNSFRTSKNKTDFIAQYSRTNSNPDALNNSNHNLTIENQDNQSSSSEKLSRENIKSYFSTHPSSTTVPLTGPLLHSESETCSGRTSEYPTNSIVAASASESISNARSFTNDHQPRRSSIQSNQRRRSWISEPNHHHHHYHHHISSLSSPIRRTKSYRYPDRIRKHSIKTKHSTEKLTRRYIQPFLSSYRQRNDEFHKVFKDLPDDERLISDYSCAWQRDILIQGRMYLSQNYLCFYSNILTWKSSLCLKFQDIVTITREKTAKVISNAIEVKLNTGEKYFFASLVAREKTYPLMFRIWQTVLIDQPLSTKDLWTMIHENYGDNLDMTTDEEDNYHKSTLKQQIQSNEKYDLSNIVLRLTQNSIDSKSFQQEDDRSSYSSRGGNQTDDEGINSIGDDMNTTSDNVEICYLSECLCQSHLSTQLIDRTYSMSVERLFDCIFGDNDFLVSYRASRRIKDFQASEWQVNNETGKRERLCKYKVDVTAVFGSTTISSTEPQIIDCELAKSHYIIDTEVRNEGIKYADHFFVASRYCLVQTGPNKCHLKVTCEVRYIKSLMAIIKTFIEKNAMAALQDSFTDLMKRLDQESSKQTRTFKSNHEQNKVNNQSHPILNRSSSRQHQSNELTSSINDLSINSEQEESIHNQINSGAPNRDVSSKNTFLIPFCIITMLLLLIVNIFLCIKLNQIDQMTDRLVQNSPSWLNKYSYQQEDNQWSSLLKKQEEYYQTQLLSLQSVLMTTHNALKNVTNALNQLSSGLT